MDFEITINNKNLEVAIIWCREYFSEDGANLCYLPHMMVTEATRWGWKWSDRSMWGIITHASLTHKPVKFLFKYKPDALMFKLMGF